MLFNSPEFAVFLLLVLVLYYVLKHRSQNLLLLVASYVFYGWWDWRFLGLIAFSTLVDYLIGLALEKHSSPSVRRGLVALSVTVNLGMLAIFKYANFFIDSLDGLLDAAGLQVQIPLLSIVLPVGISFYTFQTLSYTIDVYRGRLKATANLIDFALFVSFFPQLVAGPIERASHLLPEIGAERKTTLRQWARGGWLIYWGLFKKVVIADNLAPIVDSVYSDLPSASGLALIVATYCFAWQIYCDFSGYTDIARGCAALLGFDLCLNFNLPYFAVSPSDFWQRWHISLSSWLRDYLYIPLGGNRLGPVKTYRNLLLTMLLGGLWHGASWNFVAWGIFHGLLLTCYRRFALDALTRRLPRLLAIVLFFHVTCVGWMLFRTHSLSDLADCFFHNPSFWSIRLPDGISKAVLILPLIAMQLFQYFSQDQLVVFRVHWLVRTLLYVVMYVLLLGVGRWSENEFIYFQF